MVNRKERVVLLLKISLCAGRVNYIKDKDEIALEVLPQRQFLVVPASPGDRIR